MFAVASTPPATQLCCIDSTAVQLGITSRPLVVAILQEFMPPALTSSGLYQVLLEGTLLLLGVDPAAYPQAPEVQLHLWDSLVSAFTSATLLDMIGIK
jgi:hypothetical protein